MRGGGGGPRGRESWGRGPGGRNSWEMRWLGEGISEGALRER